MSHLKRHGCSKCAGNIKRTKEEFIVLGKTIHIKLNRNPKYGYNNVIYINRNTPVEIMCFTCNESFFKDLTIIFNKNKDVLNVLVM